MRPGCLVAVGLTLAGVVLAVALLVLLPGGDGDVDLGLLTDYEPGSVVYRSTDGFFVARLLDGSLVVLADLDPHNPPGSVNCRVTFRPELGEEGSPGRFFDACTGSLYDLGGRGLADDGLDLRRLPFEENDGRVRVSRDDLMGR